MKNHTFKIAALTALSLGMISANAEDETCKHERPSAEEIAGTMIEKHDSNSDFGLDAEELKAAFKAKHEEMKKRHQGKGPKGPRKGPGKDGEGKGPRKDGEGRPSLEDVVEKFDTNNDGTLDVEELTALIEAKQQRMKRHMRGHHGGRKGGPEGE